MKDNYFSIYLKLKLELKTVDSYIKSLSKKRDLLIYQSGPNDVKSKDYTKPKIDNFNNSDNNKLYRDIIYIQDDIIYYTNYLCDIKNDVRVMEGELEKLNNNLNDLEIKVFYNHYVLKKTIGQTATKLGYSYEWIKEINKNIRKKINTPRKTP